MLMNVALFALLMMFSVASSGCILLAAGAAGVGTAKWLSEKASQEVDVRLEKVASAAENALRSLKANVYKRTNAPEVTQILAKDNQGRQVWVDLRPVGDHHTRIDVRVGYANGEADAAKILERIVDKSKSWL